MGNRDFWGGGGGGSKNQPTSQHVKPFWDYNRACQTLLSANICIHRSLFGHGLYLFDGDTDIRKA